MTLILDNLSVLLYGFIISYVFFIVLWIVQVKSNDAGWVDIGWTLGLGSLVICLGITSEGLLARRIIASLLIGIWAIRLASFIIKDRLFKEEEDSRYQNLRRYWGNKADFKFYFFFTFQSFLVILFSIPFLPIFNNPNPLGIIDLTGIIMWLIAFIGEASADKQLRDFKKLPENKFKVCRVGFWGRSRHPNYFFEWLQWIAYVFLSIGSNEFYLSLIGPIFMYFFLIKVSGVYWVELQAVKKRGEVYKKYQQEVPMFFPKINR